MGHLGSRLNRARRGSTRSTSTGWGGMNGRGMGSGGISGVGIANGHGGPAATGGAQQLGASRTRVSQSLWTFAGGGASGIGGGGGGGVPRSRKEASHIFWIENCPAFLLRLCVWEVCLFRRL